MKPLLAATAKSINDITFPCYCTPKIDGIRCLIYNGYPVSRSLKHIRNKHVQMTLRSLPEGLDGELILNTSTEFSEVSSAIMSEDGEPNFIYCVFDIATTTSNYLDRISDVEKMYNDGSLPECVIPVVPETIHNQEEFFAYEAKCLNDGAEGIMVRNDGPYKFGRSGLREGLLLKWKRFVDSEAEILGFIEQLHNDNVAKVNALGRTERSSHKGNLIPNGMLGALEVRDIHTGVEFRIGTGFDDKLRRAIWRDKVKYQNLIVKYKKQPHGEKDKPRFPTFLGFRHEEDIR